MLLDFSQNKNMFLAERIMLFLPICPQMVTPRQPLWEGDGTHSSTLAWKIPWTEEPGRLQSMGSLRVGHDWATSLSCIGEGNGDLLQCSCLENPRDGGAWWAVYGVAQSRTWLKRLGSSSRKFTRKWLKDQHLRESIRSGTGQKEKLYCNALATKAAAIAWRALELGY